MVSLFVGVDISKDHLDFALCDPDTKSILSNFRMNNSPGGIHKAIQRLRKQAVNHSLWVCFEHTGNYGLLLSSILDHEDITFTATSALEIKRSLGVTRGKDDRIDAQRIAQYAAIHQHKLKPTQMPSDTLLKIKQLLSDRRLYVKTRTAYKNHLKSTRITHKTTDVSASIEFIKQQIKMTNQSIKQVEKQIYQLIASDEQLDKNHRKVTQVKGIGKLTAAYIQLYTNNFTAFENSRKFNCYCGLAPFASTSGSSIRGKTKTSPLRNRVIKGLIFNCANSAVQHDPQLSAYYRRKLAEGKHKMTVLNAVGCKLVSRIFAVIKRDEPFIVFSH